MARRLLLLNGFAILGIGLHHAAAYGLQAMFEWTNRYLPVTVPNYDLLGSPQYYFLMTVQLLMTWALPAFFFVSGYFIGFMARGKQATVRWETLLPRIKILLIPFSIWTVLRFALLRRLPTTLDDILNPYHFIPVLIQYYLLAPFIVRLAQRNWKLLLAGLGAVQLILPALQYGAILGVDIPGQAAIDALPRWIFLVNHIFWFPFGVVGGLHLHRYAQQLRQYRGALLAAAVVFGVLIVVEFEVLDRLSGPAWLGSNFAGVARHLFSLAAILAFFGYEKARIPWSRQLSEVGVRSLGIYLGNIPFVWVGAVLMYHLTPWLLGFQLIYFAILSVVGLGGPYMLMSFVRRSPVRGGYRYLFG